MAAIPQFNDSEHGRADDRAVGREIMARELDDFLVDHAVQSSIRSERRRERRERREKRGTPPQEKSDAFPTVERGLFSELQRKAGRKTQKVSPMTSPAPRRISPLPISGKTTIAVSDLDAAQNEGKSSVGTSKRTARRETRTQGRAFHSPEQPKVEDVENKTQTLAATGTVPGKGRRSNKDKVEGIYLHRTVSSDAPTEDVERRAQNPAYPPGIYDEFCRDAPTSTPTGPSAFEYSMRGPLVARKKFCMATSIAALFIGAILAVVFLIPRSPSLTVTYTRFETLSASESEFHFLLEVGVRISNENWIGELQVDDLSVEMMYAGNTPLFDEGAGTIGVGSQPIKTPVHVIEKRENVEVQLFLHQVSNIDIVVLRDINEALADATDFGYQPTLPVNFIVEGTAQVPFRESELQETVPYARLILEVVAQESEVNNSVTFDP